MALAGYKANVFLSTGASATVTNAAMTDGGAHTVYTITNAANRYWDSNQPITVQTSPDGSTWTTVTTGFTVQYVGGIITFAVAISGGTPSCRVTVNAFPVSFLASVQNADLQVDLGIEDSSTFQNPPSAWKTKQALMLGGTVKLQKYYIDAFFFTNLQQMMVISLYSGANANQRLEGYGYLKNDSIKWAVTKLVEEALDFELHGQLYFIQS